MQLYDLKCGQSLLEEYAARGGFRIAAFVGGLLDSYLIQAEGLKTCVIKEHYLNECSSAYTIRFYNRCPVKYEKVFDLYEGEQYEQAEKLFFRG